MGEFELPPDHVGWTVANAISDEAPLIAIPRTTVGIRQEGRPFVVADPTRAICYAAGQPYRRSLLSGEGDRCSFITFSPRLAEEAAAPYESAGVSERATYRFPFVAADIECQDYARHQRLRRAIAEGEADSDALRESLYWMVARVIASGYAGIDGTNVPRRRDATAAIHADAVDSVRASIGRNLVAHEALDELAAHAHLSPFHLARIFRERTGRSIHSYRTEIRLRASLGRIADGERLADVAAAVGFASHAHLTDRFRRAYGISPHVWRQQMSRNVEASRPEAHIA